MQRLPEIVAHFEQSLWRALPFALLLTAAASACSQTAAAVFAKSKGAVVTITTPTAVGTGFIIADGTLLVTSYHVIEGDPIPGIKISLSGARVASLAAWDEDADVAIFRLTAKAPKSLSLHPDGLLAPGSKVFVIGTPLGFLRHTITEGIVSGVRPTAGARLLQITAAVSPGSSGSPVLDSSGRVVGMVQGSIEEGQALNFAVSAFDIRRVRSKAAPPSAPSVARPPARTGGWPAGDSRLIDLASKLGSEKWGEEAARKLAKEGARAVPFLIAAFKVFEDDWGACDRAKKALAAIGRPAVEPLIRALGDSDMDVRSWAARALGMIQDARAVQPLIRALEDSDADVRDAAAGALGEIKDARAVEPLIRALGDSGWLVRHAAAWALGEIKDARAVEPLIRALGDSDAGVRSSAAWALGEIKDARAVEPLIRALSDSESFVRWSAAEALGEIKDARAVEPLIRALSDSGWLVRWSAAWALGEIKDARAVEPLIRALGDSDAGVRSSAAWALGEIKDARAVQPLIRALGDSESRVRSSAAWALGEIKDARAVQPLRRLLGDPNEDVRNAAREAIRKIEG